MSLPGVKNFVQGLSFKVISILPAISIFASLLKSCELLKKSLCSSRRYFSLKESSVLLKRDSETNRESQILFPFVKLAKTFKTFIEFCYRRLDF